MNFKEHKHDLVAALDDMALFVSDCREQIEKGKFQEAKQLLDMIKENIPSHIDALAALEQAAQNEVVEEVVEILDLEETSEVFELAEEPIDLPPVSTEILPELSLSPEVTSLEEVAAEILPEIGETPSDEWILSPKKEITTDTIADLYIKQGYPEKALEVYQSRLDANPGDMEIVRKINDIRAGTVMGAEVDTAADVQRAAVEGDDAYLNRLESWLHAIQSERRL